VLYRLQFARFLGDKIFVEVAKSVIPILTSLRVATSGGKGGLRTSRYCKCYIVCRVTRTTSKERPTLFLYVKVLET
jgi:hypothetical protein